MDLLTQGLLGATVGELAAGKKLGNKAIYWGAFAGLIPDMDTLFTPFMDVASGLLFHRGFSHSFFFIFLFAPVAAWLLFKLYKKKYDFKTWIKLMFLALFTHPLLDIFTTYGTGIFEPFSNTRIGFGTISVIDLFYTIPLLLSVSIILFLKRTNDYRYTINLGFFVISHLYLMFTVGNKISVDNLISNQLKFQKIEYNRLVTSPFLFTNFLWNVTAETDSGYYVGNYNIFNKYKESNFEFIPKNKAIPKQVLKKEEVQKLIFFSNGFYSIQEKENQLYFYDLRYGKMNLPENDRFVFSFLIQEQPFEIQRDYPDIDFNKNDWLYLKNKIIGKI